MSKCMVCKNYTDCYEVDDDLCDFKFSEKAFTEHCAKVRAVAIDRCIEIVSRETHDGTLCDYLADLKNYGGEE